MSDNDECISARNPNMFEKVEDQPQPEYCDCPGFHNGSCHQRRINELESRIDTIKTHHDIAFGALRSMYENAINVLARCVASVPELVSEEAWANPIVRKAIEDAERTHKQEGHDERINP